MKFKDIPHPRCQGQPCYMENSGTEPVTAGPYTLMTGQRACHGNDRWHKFKSRDPRGTVPTWCPRRKALIQWRLYSYEPRYQRYYEEHYRGVKALDHPHEGWYVLRYQDVRHPTAREFWRYFCKARLSVKLLMDIREPMRAGQLLVIDDGVTPRAFYMADTGLRPVEVDFDALPQPEGP